MSLTIAEMNLEPVAAAAATALLAAHPSTVFTSGRRNVAEQASAMASNIVRNRKWIVQTYMATPESRELQAWVNKNPGTRDPAGLTALLSSAMETWTDAQKANLSKHFSGQAFDVQPGSCPIEALHTLGASKLLTMEGGLVRWHLQF